MDVIALTTVMYTQRYIRVIDARNSLHKRQSVSDILFGELRAAIDDANGYARLSRGSPPVPRDHAREAVITVNCHCLSSFRKLGIGDNCKRRRVRTRRG